MPPAIIQTARGALEDRVTGLDAGADDYVVKPVEIDELAARIRARSEERTSELQSLMRISYAVFCLKKKKKKKKTIYISTYTFKQINNNKQNPRNTQLAVNHQTAQTNKDSRI